MFSEINLNSTLKDGNPQSRGKANLTKFSLIMIMLKFVEHKFFMSEFRIATLEEKGLRDLQ